MLLLSRDAFQYAYSRLAAASKIVLTTDTPGTYAEANGAARLAEVAVDATKVQIVDNGDTLDLNIAPLGAFTFVKAGTARRVVFLDTTNGRVLGVLTTADRVVAANNIPTAGSFLIKSPETVIGLTNAGQLPILTGPLPSPTPPIFEQLEAISTKLDDIAEGGVGGGTTAPTIPQIQDALPSLADIQAVVGTINIPNNTPQFTDLVNRLTALSAKVDALSSGGGVVTPAPVPVATPLVLGTYTDTSANDDFPTLAGQASATNSPTAWDFEPGSAVNDASIRLGTFGTFSVIRATGAVTYTPDDVAINAYEGAGTTDVAQLIAKNAAGNSAPVSVTVNIIGQVDIVDGIDLVVPATGETDVEFNLTSVPDGNDVTITNNTEVPLKVYF